MESRTHYDVVILGSSLSATLMANILARNGCSVLMIEKGQHPRFAIGEATTPDMSFRFKIVAAKYGVPEIAHLGSFHQLRDHVGPSCGVKRSFSFVYHREGQPQNPKESHQYPTLSAPMGPDCHLFRQDTDAYLLASAVRYGADVRQRTGVAAVDLRDDGVAVTTDKGETYTGRFLVDASGGRSVLAKQLGLRADPVPFRTNSRGMFTHMVGVKLYDQVGAPREAYDLQFPISQGTLHHVFEGGWFWVIPFNNHTDSVNPLCSVGLLLNRERYPETGMDPEEEFFAFVDRFPALKKQFEGARAVRDWTAAPGRLQYATAQTTGARHALVPNTAAFIDPLFSSGINLTLAGVDLLARRLLGACREDDFTAERFEPVNAFLQRVLRHYDLVVSNAFDAFPHYDLWDAWYRVWVSGMLVSTELNADLYLRHLETGDPAVLDATETAPYNDVLGYGFGPQRRLFDAAHAAMERFRSGEATAAEAAAAIRDLYRETAFVPSYWRWHDPAVRATPAFTLWGMTRMYFWYRLRAPREVSRQLYGWGPWTAYRYIFRSIRAHNKQSRRRRNTFVRDVFRAWNRDWATS